MMCEMMASLGADSGGSLLAMRVLSKKRKSSAPAPSLEGQLLIAMPTMADKRFARSVVYMCAHSPKGAMGLIINQRAAHISFPELLEQLKILKRTTVDGLSPALFAMDVHVGGPVETGRGFVLHSADYFVSESTLTIDTGVSLTATVDILKAIAKGDGPDRSILALGYAQWRAGQLENEIRANGWLHCEPDADLIFDPVLETKYTRAMGRLGVNPLHLVSEAGHA